MKRPYFFPLIAVAFVLGAALLVKLLWNAVLPDVAPGVSRLDYPHALGLLILCRILFGGLGGRMGRPGGGGGPWQQGAERRRAWHEKWKAMSTEERQRFKEEWRQRRCGK